MTTINQFSDLPSAEAIGVLANELFPDLTEGVYGVPEQDIPVDDVPEVNSSDFTQGYGTSAPAYSLSESDPVASNNYASSTPGIAKPGFDWEHPFAYGGSSQDSYFSVMRAHLRQASQKKSAMFLMYLLRAQHLMHL